MTREEFDTLCRDDVRRAVEENLGRDPLAVSPAGSLCAAHASLDACSKARGGRMQRAA